MLSAIDGNWGPWSEWIQDSSTEDFLRYRECSNPEPMHDGAPCVGLDVDVSQKPKGNMKMFMFSLIFLFISNQDRLNRN